MTVRPNQIESRAQLFAQQTLGGDPEQIRAGLRGRSIIVGLPDRLAGCRQAQIGLVTVVNVLSRLGALAPNLYLDVSADAVVASGVPLLPTGLPLGVSLLTFMRELTTIQPSQLTRSFASRNGKYDYGLFVGDTTRDASVTITVGADGWLAAVNPDGVTEAVTDGENPFGILLAATLGSTEIVKHIWLTLGNPHATVEPMRRRTLMSAYDANVNATRKENPELPARCKLGHVCVFGLGAIGSACNYVLGCLPKAEMSIDFVDMDRIEPSNEERLFTSAKPETDIRVPKVVHAQRFISGSHPNVRAFASQMSFERYVETARERLGYVWCCLDSATARRTLQTELASVLVNGGTDLSRWMISLHEYDRPENACLRDLYPAPAPRVFDPERELAHQLDVPVERIREIARSRTRLNAAEIQTALRNQKDEASRKAVARYVGMDFDQAVAHMCSTVRPSKALPAATISFVSLMPAVFMVADLVKRRVYGWHLPEGQPNVYQFDCLRLPEHRTACNILAARECLCQSERYRRAFQQRQRLRQKYLNSPFSSPPSAQARRAPPHGRGAAARPAAVRQPWLVNWPPPEPRSKSKRFALVSASALLWIVALSAHLAGISGIAWLMTSCAEREPVALSDIRPWRLVVRASNAKVTRSSWLTYTTLSGLPTVTFLPLVLMTTGVLKPAIASYRRGRGRAAPEPARVQAVAERVAGSLFAAGLPWVSLGVATLAVINGRALWSIPGPAYACCLVLLIAVVWLFGMLYACAGMVAVSWVVAMKRCVSIYGIRM
jgi:molybdopterin/thiamine biosynthesis adenylyltransferase